MDVGSSKGRFDTGVYAQRLEAARDAAERAGLAGLVITPGYDLRYLVGSRTQTFERLTALVLPTNGAPTVVVPRMELASLRESAVTELGLAVRDWVDGDDPYRLVADALGGGPESLPGSLRSCPPESLPGSLRSCPPESLPGSLRSCPPIATAVTDSMPALHLL